jgi:hypothetical protein
MFKSDAQWPIAAAHVGAIAVSEGPVLHLTDDELTQMASFIYAHHMKIFLETGIISRQKGSKFGGGEGYCFPAEIRATCEKMQKFGLTVDYLRMDEPIWFGHYNKNDAYVQQLAIPDLVQRVKEDADEVIKVFPNVQLVDIDPIPPVTMQPDWQPTYKDYLQQLEAALNKPVVALQVDVQWKNPAWMHDLKEFADFAHGLGMKFGVIYNSDGSADTDEDWIKAAEKSFTVVESLVGVIPEQPVFQSWDKIPSHALPETSPAAHTHLIDRYLLPRTRIVAQRGAGAITGQLLDQAGHPVAGATVSMTAPSFDPAKPLALLTVSGTVPAKALTAIMGIRVNCECLCDGSNDFYVGKFSYQETAGGTVSQTLDYPAEIQAHPPQNIKYDAETIGGDAVAHLVIPPDQTLGANSPAFTVTPGAQFTFQASADLVSGDGLFGKILVIWLDAQKHGFGTATITVNRHLDDAGSAVTGPDGKFALPLPASSAAAAGPLHLRYEGSDTLRPSLTVLP